MYKVSTLEFLINLQELIIIQAGKFPKITNCAGCDKAMQVAIRYSKINLAGKFSRFVKRAACKITMQVGIIRSCSEFIR